MDISVGDRVEMKKQHPCGCKTFEILRVGMEATSCAKNAAERLWRPVQRLKKILKKF